MLEIIFRNSTEGNINTGSIDGGCYIEKDLWPKQNNTYLFCLLSMPAKWLIEINNEKIISIFIPYDKEDFSHYSQMSSYEPNHEDSFVILHEQTNKIESLNLDQSNKAGQVLIKKPSEGSSPNLLSYIGGEPKWVQDEIKVPDYHWSLSIYGPDIDEALVDNAGILSGGTLHVFLKDKIDFDSNGTIIGKTFFEL